jgi:hypothetical protein
MIARLFGAVALLASVLSASTSSAAAQSFAGCRLRIDSSTSSWIIRGYDLFGNSPPLGTFEVVFANEGEQPCEFYPRFMLDAEPFGLQGNGGSRIPYTLLDDYAGYDATPVSGRTLPSITRRSINVAPGGQRVVNYRLRVQEQALTADGLYSQRIAIQAETREGALLNSRQLVVGVDVLPSALIGLSGAFRNEDGRAIVKLGELQQGIAPVPLNLRIRSTRAYRVDIQSQSGGYLVLSGTEWKIPYQVVVGDQTLRMSGLASYTATSGTNGLRDSVPLRFAIGDVDDKRAGVYSDVMTITVSTN